jgi:hypothetical protein
MNQYRCDETCNKKGTERCPIEFSTVEREAERVSETCGLVCHSDFQSERDKVLDELYNWYKEKDKIILSDHRIPLWELEHKIAELQQQAGDP